MTWLEKFKKEHPAMAEDYIIAEFCPLDVLVGKCPEDGAGNELECEECWKRQMPENSEAGPDK